MRTFTTRILTVVLGVLFGAASPAGAYTVFGDSYASGWDKWFWGSQYSSGHASETISASHNFGGRGIYMAYGGQWSALNLHTYYGFYTGGYDVLTFWIRAPADSNVRLQISMRLFVQRNYGMPLNNYLPEGRLKTNEWVKVVIPLADLGFLNSWMTDILFMNTENTYPGVCVDDVQFEYLGVDGPGVIYQEGPPPGTQNWSWSEVKNLFYTEGCASPPLCAQVRFTYGQAWSGFYLQRQTGMSSSGFNTLAFKVKAPNGWTDLQDLQVKLGEYIPIGPGSRGLRGVMLKDYLPARSQVPSNQWLNIEIPLADLDAAGKTISSFTIMNSVANPAPTIYLDDIGLVDRVLSPDFRLPLPPGKHWYLTVEAGGRAAYGANDPFHYINAAYFSIDFSPRTLENSGNPEVNVQILAAANGQVIEVATTSLNGNYVRIDHDWPYDGSGYTTYYLHLASYVAGIQPGVYLQRGQRLGTMGNTGDSDGTHIHFQIKYNNSSSLDATATGPIRAARIEGLGIEEFRAGQYYQSTNY